MPIHCASSFYIQRRNILFFIRQPIPEPEFFIKPFAFKIRRLLCFVLPALAIGCAPTLKLKAHPASINLCPYFSADEDSTLVGAYKAELTLRHIKDPGFIKSVACDSASYPNLNLYYGRTSIAGSQEKTRAYAVTALGIATPVAMIAAGMPIFVAFWSVPANRMAMNVDVADSLKTGDKAPPFFVNTSAWTGNRESQIERQAAESGRVVEGILAQVKGSK